MKVKEFIKQAHDEGRICFRLGNSLYLGAAWGETNRVTHIEPGDILDGSWETVSHAEFCDRMYDYQYALHDKSKCPDCGADIIVVGEMKTPVSFPLNKNGYVEMDQYDSNPIEEDLRATDARCDCSNKKWKLVEHESGVVEVVEQIVPDEPIPR